MESDTRLNGQLKSLGKKLFQFRDLVAKLEIPEDLPDPGAAQLFWETFVKKCGAAVTVLRQIQSSLTPDMYHLSVYPSEKIWRTPAAVPDLLSLPEGVTVNPSCVPIAASSEQVQEWNTMLENATFELEQFVASTQSLPKRGSSNQLTRQAPQSAGPDPLIARLFSTTSEQRAAEDTSSR